MCGGCCPAGDSVTSAGAASTSATPAFERRPGQRPLTEHCSRPGPCHSEKRTSAASINGVERSTARSSRRATASRRRFRQFSTRCCPSLRPIERLEAVVEGTNGWTSCCRRRRSEPPRRPSPPPLNQPGRPSGMRVASRRGGLWGRRHKAQNWLTSASAPTVNTTSDMPHRRSSASRAQCCDPPCALAPMGMYPVA